MQIIDLTKPGDNYKIIAFPDGEKHLELTPLNRKEAVDVRCRITNGDDLFVLMQLSDILKRQCIEVGNIIIDYLMGMRCDRLFDINRPFTLGIITDVVNSFGAKTVLLIEPHSNRSIIMINNSMPCSQSFRIGQELKTHNPNIEFVAPDKGAEKRYSGCNFKVICEKVREEATGKLLSFKAEAKEDVSGRDLLVIDDLCDGGGTFAGLAPELRKLNPKSLSLMVTHAVQKQGIERVAEVYDTVYITNSYKDWSKEILPNNLVVFDALGK